MNWRDRLYRVLVGFYPADFRTEHADCVVGTLLEGADQRSALGELREVAGLLVGAVRARGESAASAGRGKWRHGFAWLVMPLAVVQLATLAAALWCLRQPFLSGGFQATGTWWMISIAAAAGVLVAVSLCQRRIALFYAVVGLVPLGYDEWLQAVGRGGEDHLSIAQAAGFTGPPMSPFLLFSGCVLVVALLAWSPQRSSNGRARRALSLILATAAIGALIPVSLEVLLELSLAVTLVCTVLGGLDRRIFGMGLGLWLVVLPYMFWWWSGQLFSIDESATYLFLVFLVLPLLSAFAALLARWRRGRLA